MNIKLDLEPNKSIIPDIMVPTDEGMKSNVDEKLITGVIVTATAEQRHRYIGYASSRKSGGVQRSEILINVAIKKHLKKVTGLEDFGITNGITLLEHERENSLFSDIIDLFFNAIARLGASQDEDLDEGEL